MSTQPAAVAPPISREEALKKLGLFARHDYISMIFLIVSWIAWFAYLVLVPEPHWRLVVGWFGLNMLVASTWTIVLAYRGLIFTLDLHAEVALMPEASARIAVGYFEGRTKR